MQQFMGVLLTGNNIEPQQSQDNYTITEEEFNDWKNTRVFDTLKGLKVGQSFCKRFHVNDAILFYSLELTTDFVDDYIKKTYVTPCNYTSHMAPT